MIQKKTDVGNDPKTCIRAYHLDDDVGVIEHSRDQVSFDEPLEDKGYPLGWSQSPVYCVEIWRADGQSLNGEIGVEGITGLPNEQRGDRHERTDATTKMPFWDGNQKVAADLYITALTWYGAVGSTDVQLENALGRGISAPVIQAQGWKKRSQPFVSRGWWASQSTVCR